MPLVTHDSNSKPFKKSRDEVKDEDFDRAAGKGSRTVRAGLENQYDSSSEEEDGGMQLSDYESRAS